MEVTPLSLIIPSGTPGTGPNLQSAVNQAKATSAAVWIPADYAGTDTYTNPNNVPVFDMRGSGTKTFGVTPNTPSPVNLFNVKNYGAKGDTQHVIDGVVSSGVKTVTSATATFKTSDVGKFISCANNGTTFMAATAKILSTTPTVATTDTNATGSQGGLDCIWYTQD